MMTSQKVSLLGGLHGILFREYGIRLAITNYENLFETYDFSPLEGMIHIFDAKIHVID